MVGLSNLVSLFVSAGAIVLLPGILSVADFGYFQFYLLVASLAGFLHLGWADGVYLALGGARSDVLRSAEARSDWLRYASTQIVVSILLALVVWSIVPSGDRLFVWLAGAASVGLANLRVYIYMACQAVGLVSRYALFVLLDRIVFVLVAVALLGWSPLGFMGVIYADLAGRLVSLGVALCSSSLSGPWLRSERRPECLAVEHIRVGLPLMVANFAGQLILGSTRFMVDASMGIESFAALSFALSLASLGAALTSALGVPLFPRLRRLNEDEIRATYGIIRPRLGQVSLTVTLTFPVIVAGVTMFLPKYTHSIDLLAVLFPVVLYEAQVAIVYAPYLKALDRPVRLLLSNTVGVVLSVGLGVVACFALRDIRLAAMAILLSVVIRARLAERLTVSALSLRSMGERWVEDLCLAVFLWANTGVSAEYSAWIWVAVTLGGIAALEWVARAYRLASSEAGRARSVSAPDQRP